MSNLFKTLDDFDNQDVFDSRDFIEAMESWRGVIEDEEHTSQERIEAREELDKMESFISELKGAEDWEYGESVISQEYFTDYIKEMILECYELPDNTDCNEWPYRHQKMDFEAAAEEVKIDYIESNGYLIRA